MSAPACLDWRPFDPAEEYGPDLYNLARRSATGQSTTFHAASKWLGHNGVWEDSEQFLYPDATWQIFGPIAPPEWGDK